MSLLKQSDTVINISSSVQDVIEMYLKVYLAKERLTEKQLQITAVLVAKYAEYIYGGVAEPYASKLLFSTETRKEIYEKLKISAAHLNNNFTPLIDKGVMAQDGKSYMLNPELLPSKTLIFNFSINAK